MRTLSKTPIFAVLLGLIGVFALSTPVLAFTPTLSISYPGNGVATLTVYGDANSAVQLYYYSTSYNSYNTNTPTYAATIGTTNSSGYLSLSVSLGSYNIPTGASVYVLVNGQQSAIVSWPVSSGYTNTNTTTYPYNSNCPYIPAGNYSGYNGCTPIPVSPAVPIVPPPVQQPLETGSLSLAVNQTTSVYGQNNSPYTVTSNSNPSVVSTSASGNAITFSGNEAGSASVIVCPASYGYNNGFYQNAYPYGSNYGYANASCADFIVTVTPALTFSQSNVTLYGLGASQSISVSGGYGYNNSYAYNGYYGGLFITGNTNPSAVSAVINGNQLNVYAVGYGGSTLTVCANGGVCGTVYVSVNGSNYYYSSYYPQSYSAPQTYYRAPTSVMRGWYRRW